MSGNSCLENFGNSKIEKMIKMTWKDVKSLEIEACLDGTSLASMTGVVRSQGKQRP